MFCSSVILCSFCRLRTFRQSQSSIVNRRLVRINVGKIVDVDFDSNNAMCTQIPRRRERPILVFVVVKLVIPMVVEEGVVVAAVVWYSFSSAGTPHVDASPQSSDIKYCPSVSFLYVSTAPFQSNTVAG